MAIISPAEVGGASFSMSKSLCVEVDGRRLINCKKKKLRAGYYALPSAISHLNPTSPPFTLHATLLLPFSPSLPVSLHKLISQSLPLPALSLSPLWVNRDELLNLKSMSLTVAGMRKGCSTTIANHGVKFDAGALTDGGIQQRRLFLWPGSSMHHVGKSTWTSYLCSFCQGPLILQNVSGIMKAQEFNWGGEITFVDFS